MTKRATRRPSDYEKQIWKWVCAIAKRQRDYVMSIPLVEIKTPKRKGQNHDQASNR